MQREGGGANITLKYKSMVYLIIKISSAIKLRQDTCHFVIIRVIKYLLVL